MAKRTQAPMPRASSAPALSSIYIVLDEGDFDAPCELCATVPSAIRVVRWDTDPEAVQKLGAIGGVERRYYCPEHQGAAEAQYQAWRAATPA